jgi:glycosyltransferase involved in cell wall biosynthesis
MAFLKIGNFSLVNEHLLEAFASDFPDFDIDVIDVLEDLVNYKSAKNIALALKEYSAEILSRRARIGKYLLRTNHFFWSVKEAVGKRLGSGQYAMTFQTQSLFDGSVPGIPHFIYTDHTHLANLRYPGFTAKQLYARSWVALERSIYENANIVFTLSEFASGSVIEDYHCPADKVVCVYTGLNAKTTFTPGQKDYSAKHILFVGVDWERKGGPELVAAFKKVLEVHPDAHLTIVGCSPSLDLPNCRVVGRVPSDQVGQYFEKATIFCLPSRLEPAGIAFSEAAASGLPVVATNIGGIPDRVVDGKTGYLVNSTDVDQLTRALIDLLADQEKRQNFGAEGYRLASERFSWQKVSADIKKQVTPFIGESGSTFSRPGRSSVGKGRVSN